MPTYSFKCPEGHYHDKWKSVSERQTDECPECGQEGRLVVTKAPALDNYHMGLSPSNPTAWDKWARMKQAVTAKEEKCYREHGDYGPGYSDY